MSLARAIGFIAGGAAQGYGQGVVQQAKMNWDKMLSDENNARADARLDKTQKFEGEQTDKKIASEQQIAGENQFGALARTTAEIKSRESTADKEIAGRKDVAGMGMSEIVKVEPDDSGKLHAITKGGKAIDLGLKGQAAAKDLKLQTDDQGALRVVDEQRGTSKVVTDENGDPVYAQVKADPLSEFLSGKSAEKTGEPKTKAPVGRPMGAAPGFGGAPEPAVPTAPAAPAVASPQTAPSEDEKAAAVTQARAAIAKGAPREQVIQRLKDNGIDASGL